MCSGGERGSYLVGEGELHTCRGSRQNHGADGGVSRIRSTHRFFQGGVTAGLAATAQWTCGRRGALPSLVESDEGIVSRACKARSTRSAGTHWLASCW